MVENNQNIAAPIGLSNNNSVFKTANVLESFLSNGASTITASVTQINPASNTQNKTNQSLETNKPILSIYTERGITNSKSPATNIPTVLQPKTPLLKPMTVKPPIKIATPPLQGNQEIQHSREMEERLSS